MISYSYRYSPLPNDNPAASLPSQENERLYQKLGSSQKELKSVRAQLFEENQRLTAELLNAR